MVELTLTMDISPDKSTVCKLSPGRIVLGNSDASGIDVLHVNVPDEMLGMNKRITLKHKNSDTAIERMLDMENNVVLDGIMTADNGTLTFDAWNSEKHYYSTNVSFNTINHINVNGEDIGYKPTYAEELLNDCVSARNEAIVSAQTAKKYADSMANISADVEDLKQADVRLSESITDISDVAISKKQDDIFSLLTKSNIQFSDGSLTGASGWKSTDYIVLGDESKISANVYTFKSADKTLYNIAFYDVSKNLIVGIGGASSNSKETLTLSVPSNAVYYRIADATTAKNNTETVATFYEYKQLSTEEELEALKTYAENTFVKKQGSDIVEYDYFSELTKSTIYLANNTTASYTGWKSTDFKIIDFVHIKGSLYGWTTFASFAFFDIDKKYIGGAIGKANGVVFDFDMDVPNNAVYYRVVDYTAVVTESIVELTPIASDTHTITSEHNHYKTLFNDVLCVGDSLTEGDYGSNPVGTVNIHSENYPYFMKLETEWETDNHGKCGFDTEKYWNRIIVNPTSYNLQSYAIDTSKHYDIIFVALGTNGTMTNTVTTDIVGDDYNAYASTQTGYYGKIVKWLKDNFPNAVIALVNVPQNAQTASKAPMQNKVIKDVAEKFGCLYLDVFNYSAMKFDGKKFRPIDDIHYGKVGYNTFAHELFSLFCMEYFKHQTK